jgi:hypothetical protein
MYWESGIKFLFVCIYSLLVSFFSVPKNPTFMAGSTIDSAGERILIAQADPVRLGARGLTATPGAWPSSWPGAPACAAKYCPEHAPH